MNAIVMTEEFWRNSPFSIARYYGRISIEGKEYVIVNKDGKDIFQCSAEAAKMGREKFLQFIKDNPDITTVKQAKEKLEATNQ